MEPLQNGSVPGDDWVKSGINARFESKDILSDTNPPELRSVLTRLPSLRVRSTAPAEVCRITSQSQRSQSSRIPKNVGMIGI